MAKLLSRLPVGALVKDTGTTYNGVPIVWQVMEHGHEGDPEGSTALIAQKVLMVKCFDAPEPNNNNTSIQRLGNSRYLYSNILQWLNSDANDWYNPQHGADEAPMNGSLYKDKYAQEKGFLSYFSSSLKAAVFTVTKRTYYSSEQFNGVYDDVPRKVFLLGLGEVGLEENVFVDGSLKLLDEGSIYEIFNTASNRISFPTPEETAITNNSVIKPTESIEWWMRTGSGDNTCCAINKTGEITRLAPSGSGWIGVRPAFTVPSMIYVSDTEDDEGIYTILWNLPPVITTDDMNLGTKSAPFTIRYTIDDPDGDNVDVTISIDDKVVQNISIIDQSQEYSYTINQTIFDSLENGTHEITITADDLNGNESSIVINFNKLTIPITITGTDLLLGNVWQTPTYTYQISGSDINVRFHIVEAFDDEIIREITDASYDTDITADFSGFGELSNEDTHVFTITATDANGSMAVRTITFTKLGDKIVFYTNAVETDEAALKIITEVSYTTEGSPVIKVEATNNAAATTPVWEDMTNEFLARNFHTFTNKPTDGFGVSVRVTLTKNAETERIYIDSMGFSFY